MKILLYPFFLIVIFCSYTNIYATNKYYFNINPLTLLNYFFSKTEALVPGDNDDDSILDANDDDDDNDGILDVEEIAACNNMITFEFYDLVPPGNTVNNIPTTGATAVGIFNSFNVDAIVAALGEVNDTYSIRFTGNINITTAGNYTFFTTSDDGSSLSIDGNVVVLNDGLQAPTEDSGTINLTAGTHTIEVLFFENFGGEVLLVQYQGPGIAKQNIPFSALTCDPDIDNDGLPNVFDTDSDGDGCPDALEGDGSFSRAVLDTDESYGDNVNTNGVALISGVSTEQLNVSAYRSYVMTLRCGADMDSDGISNSFDLDDDNDGILDFEEAESCINTVSFEYYDGTPSGATVNNIPTTGADATGTFNSFDVDALIASLGEDNNTYGIRYTGLLNITTAGAYTFYTTSDDGSSLTIDEVLIVNNDGNHASQERSGTVTLSVGAHFFTVLFFENGGFENLSVEYEGPGITRQELPFTSIACNLDTDNDGMSNYLDTDSDADGCIDAIEADGNFTLSDIDPLTDMLLGDTDTNGIPLLASPSGQPNNSTVINLGTVTENTFSSAIVTAATGNTTSFNITVNETNGNTNFQWQTRSNPTDPFINISNGGVTPNYSGVNTSTLTISNIPIDLNNSEFRVVFFNENSPCNEVISSEGILNVFQRNVITNRKITYRIKRN